jgi:hypothetical protein
MLSMCGSSAQLTGECEPATLRTGPRGWSPIRRASAAWRLLAETPSSCPFDAGGLGEKLAKRA